MNKHIFFTVEPYYYINQNQFIDNINREGPLNADADVFNVLNDNAYYNQQILFNLDGSFDLKLSGEQFMLGDEFLIAPVMNKGENKVRLYLPQGSWVHLWTENNYVLDQSGKYIIINAPIGPGQLK